MKKRKRIVPVEDRIRATRYALAVRIAQEKRMSLYRAYKYIDMQVRLGLLDKGVSMDERVEMTPAVNGL